MRVLNRRRLAGLLIAGGLLLTGCSSESEPEPPATLPSDADVVIAAGAEVMGDVDTVRFSIERSGAPVHIDPDDLLTFNKAEGRFAAPSSADALVTIQVAGFNTEIGAIAFEGKTWLSEPITGAFALAPGSYAFDPATLFDPDIGWRPLLAGGLTEIEWLGQDDVAGEDRYRLRGLADPDRVEVITAGLVRDQEVVLDIAFDTITGAVREVEFSTVNDGQESTWSLEFWDYGEPVEVSPPPTNAGG